MSPPGLVIHNDMARFELDRVCEFIAESYWGQGRSRTRILKSFEGSLCFGAFLGEEQVGFARVAGDRVFFAYLMDLFVFPAQRGQGIGKALMDAILTHPELSQVTTFMLSTKDGHSLYARFGFAAPAEPARIMVRKTPEV
ncbi:MAG: GNAT family N-acetyltransferase [Pseudomonadota bacterium]